MTYSQFLTQLLALTTSYERKEVDRFIVFSDGRWLYLRSAEKRHQVVEADVRVGPTLRLPPIPGR